MNCQLRLAAPTELDRLALFPGPLEELRNTDFETVSQPLQGLEAGIALAPLNPSDICAVEVRLCSEGFLRKPTLFT